MQTECSATLLQGEAVERQAVMAGFDGGDITSNAGALLLGQVDRGLGLIHVGSPVASPTVAMLVTLSTGLRHWWDSGSLAWCWATRTSMMTTTSCAKTQHSAC